MKKVLSILTLSASMLFANAAMAEGYFGVGVNQANSSTFDSAGINIGLVGGVDMSDAFAVELDFDTSVTKAKVSTIETSLQTIGLYGVFRSSGDTYFKGKVGYHSTTTKTTASTTTSALAYGVGVGFGGGYELEYTSLQPEDSSGEALNKISFSVLFN